MKGRSSTSQENDARVNNGYGDFEEIYQKKYIGNRYNSVERSRSHSRFHNDMPSAIKAKARASDGALNVYNDIFHNYPPFANRYQSRIFISRCLKSIKLWETNFLVIC